MPTTEPLARDFYIVRFSFRDRDRQLHVGTYEIDDERNDRRSVVKDIATGQYEHVTHVLEYCADSQRVQDVTEDIARDVMNELREMQVDQINGSLRDFLETELGCYAPERYLAGQLVPA